jgi:predicted small lipoprotein YifL
MLRKMRLFLFLLLTGLAVSGCGQKGPLYKSPAAEANQTEKQQAIEPESQSMDTHPNNSQ